MFPTQFLRNTTRPVSGLARARRLNRELCQLAEEFFAKRPELCSENLDVRLGGRRTRSRAGQPHLDLEKLALDARKLIHDRCGNQKSIRAGSR